MSASIYRTRQRLQITDTALITDSGIKFAIDSALDEVKNLTGVSVTSGAPQGFEPSITNFACYFSLLGIMARGAEDAIGYRLGRLAVFKRDRIRGLEAVATQFYNAGKDGLLRGMSAPLPTRIEFSGTKTAAEGAEREHDPSGD